MNVSLFDYSLPPDRIAQKSIEPREAAKLLVLDRKTGAMIDKHIRDLPELLRAGDLLVFNDSKVFKARLMSGDIELFLLRPEGKHWIALGKKLKTGSSILFDDVRVNIIEKRDDGTVLIDFGMSVDEVFALCDRIGEVPVPPYVETTVENTTAYQTTYAKHVGSVAAPTAGFHFTPELLREIVSRKSQVAFVTLHVGLGTFRPMKNETLEEHVMHEEWAHVPEETRRAIEETKKNGGRVIVVGTTAMRALESGVDSGFTKLFITPGYQFKIADGLITNFHLPKSTLLVLVSAFAGRENVLNAYKHAIEQEYRFYSFGDAMLVI